MSNTLSVVCFYSAPETHGRIRLRPDKQKIRGCYFLIFSYTTNMGSFFSVSFSGWFGVIPYQREPGG